MPLPGFPRPAHRLDTSTARLAARRLVASMRYELVPLKSVDQALSQLPSGAPVSVTCSPTRGVDATIALTERLLAAGHDPVPHLSARSVEGPRQVRRLARWTKDAGLHRIFVIGGDAPHSVGPYPDAMALLRSLFEHDTGLTGVGVAAYPDGHGLIGSDAARRALLQKQQLFADVGLEGWATTQMCFDAERIRTWLTRERAAGLSLPVHLGIPGLVDRTQLMKMGLRLGVGPSLRYLHKNRAVVGRLLSNGRYDPTSLVAELAPWADDLGIAGLHSFTFNRVAATRTWQERFVASTAG